MMKTLMLADLATPTSHQHTIVLEREIPPNDLTDLFAQDEKIFKISFFCMGIFPVAY